MSTEREKTSPVVAYDSVSFMKGELIGAGASGIVELTTDKVVLKSPWSGREKEDCRQDITQEAAIYRRLGPHPHLVRILSWDEKECVLGMEYMPNGTLGNYIEQNNPKLNTASRLRWAAEVAEVLAFVHRAGVFHCDLKPKNIVLDPDTHIKLIDFSSSSINGSKPTGCAGVRFMPPGNFNAFGERVDLFALGSTIYQIATGAAPYHDVASDDVWPLFTQSKFPDTTGVLCGDIIDGCWKGTMRNAADVQKAIEVLIQELATA